MRYSAAFIIWVFVASRLAKLRFMVADIVDYTNVDSSIRQPVAPFIKYLPSLRMDGYRRLYAL